MLFQVQLEVFPGALHSVCRNWPDQMVSQDQLYYAVVACGHSKVQTVHAALQTIHSA